MHVDKIQDINIHYIHYIVYITLAVNFTRDLERRLCKPPESLQPKFLLQRISVAVQRGSTAAVLGAMKRRLDGWEWLWLLWHMHVYLLCLIEKEYCFEKRHYLMIKTTLLTTIWRVAIEIIFCNYITLRILPTHVQQLCIYSHATCPHWRANVIAQVSKLILSSDSYR